MSPLETVEQAVDLGANVMGVSMSSKVQCTDQGFSHVSFTKSFQCTVVFAHSAPAQYAYVTYLKHET